MERFRVEILVILSLIPLAIIHLGVALSNDKILNEAGDVSFGRSLPYLGMTFILYVTNCRTHPL